MAFTFSKKNNSENLFTIAFYNLENLFDIYDDPNILDNDFTPKGANHWNKKRYQKKIYKLGKAISLLALDKTHKPPVLVGIAEVENRKVLQDLVNSKHLKKNNFDIVHYNSPDERGIDTALLYQKKYFKITHSNVIPVLIYEENGIRDFTRDILHIAGFLNNQYVHIFVNHWPSRKNDATLTDFKRVEAAKTLRTTIEHIRTLEEDPTFIIMGDFNDNPQANSIKNHLLTPYLYNPMEKLLSYHKGSLRHDSKWYLFDQIIISRDFFDVAPNTHTFANANIFDDRFLAEWSGRFKGNPFRTYVGRKYLGGYSDHFPVYIQLQLNM